MKPWEAKYRTEEVKPWEVQYSTPAEESSNLGQYAEEVGKGAFLGAQRGATFGFADEIKAALAAPMIRAAGLFQEGASSGDITKDYETALRTASLFLELASLNRLFNIVSRYPSCDDNLASHRRIHSPNPGYVLVNASLV